MRSLDVPVLGWRIPKAALKVESRWEERNLIRSTVSGGDLELRSGVPHRGGKRSGGRGAGGVTNLEPLRGFLRGQRWGGKEVGGTWE